MVWIPWIPCHPAAWELKLGTLTNEIIYLYKLYIYIYFIDIIYIHTFIYIYIIIYIYRNQQTWDPLNFWWLWVEAIHPFFKMMTNSLWTFLPSAVQASLKLPTGSSTRRIHGFPHTAWTMQKSLDAKLRSPTAKELAQWPANWISIY